MRLMSVSGGTKLFGGIARLPQPVDSMPDWLYEFKMLYDLNGSIAELVNGANLPVDRFSSDGL